MDLTEWCETDATAIVTAMSVSVPNIGPQQLRRRLTGGVVSLVISTVLAAALAAADASVAARAIVALPVYAAALGFLQYRAKT